MPQTFGINGPLAALELPSAQGATSFYYPSDLTTISNHYMRFDCCIFQDSRYQQGVSGNPGAIVNTGLGLLKAVGAAAILSNPITAVLASAGFVVAAINGSIPNAALGPRSAAQNLNSFNAAGGTTGALTTQFYSAFPGLRGIGNKTVLNHLYLYTPDTMIFDYNNEWKTISLREQFGAAGIAGQSAIDLAGGHSLQGFGTAAMGGADVFGAAGIKSSIETATAMLGYPVNPMTETLFSDTRPRHFKFNWTLYPQTAAESTEIYNIIQQFTFHAASEFATSELGGFLVMPSVFDIKYMFTARSSNGTVREMENPWIKKISTCALTDISVNFAPNGWQANEDGSPAAVDINLSFTELDIITKDRVVSGF